MSACSKCGHRDPHDVTDREVWEALIDHQQSGGHNTNDKLAPRLPDPQFIEEARKAVALRRETPQADSTPIEVGQVAQQLMKQR